MPTLKLTIKTKFWKGKIMNIKTVLSSESKKVRGNNLKFEVFLNNSYMCVYVYVHEFTLNCPTNK